LVNIPNIGIISKYILGIFRVWVISHNVLQPQEGGGLNSTLFNFASNVY